MKLFIDLSLNFAPQEIFKRISVWGAGRPDFLGSVVFQCWPSESLGDFSCVAREAFSIAAEVSHSADIF